MSSLLLFAKGDPGAGAVGAILALVGCVAFFIWFAAALASAPDVEMVVVLKNGVPYCRRCGRQVSRRRDHCRACGLSLYVPKAPPPPPDPMAIAALRAAEAVRDEQIRRDAEKWRLERERRRADRAAARSAQLKARDLAYRARGIEPGPWAWFKALPEVTQTILLCITFAAPAGVVAWAIFSSR